MDNEIKSEKYRGLSIASIIIGFLPCCYALLLFFFVSYYSAGSLIKEHFSSELTMFGLSVFKATFLVAGFAMAAIVCGSIDLKRIKEGIFNGKGKGLDITGLVFGGLTILLIAIWFMLGII
jgi:hypothetical protein